MTLVNIVSNNRTKMNDSKSNILLFDGVCNLCNYLVTFIINRDINRKFKFTSLQSDKGQAILKHKVGVLNVRIIAPETLRVERIMKSKGLNREAALKLIKDNDQATAEYLRRFYNINWGDPELYDLVLNTGKIDLDKAAQVISSATSQP